MPRHSALRNSWLAGLLVAGAFLALPAFAQEGSPEKYLELMRTDIRTAKVALLTDALNLSQTQADAFWPLYREYDTEASALGDRRVAMVKQFAAKYGSLTDTDAAGFMTEWFALQKDRLKIREKYSGKISKAVSSLIAARFLQVDYTLGMLIDLSIAAELPLME